MWRPFYNRYGLLFFVFFVWGLLAFGLAQLLVISAITMGTFLLLHQVASETDVDEDLIEIWQRHDALQAQAAAREAAGGGEVSSSSSDDGGGNDANERAAEGGWVRGIFRGVVRSVGRGLVRKVLGPQRRRPAPAIRNRRQHAQPDQNRLAGRRMSRHEVNRAVDAARLPAAEGPIVPAIQPPAQQQPDPPPLMRGWTIIPWGWIPFCSSTPNPMPEPRLQPPRQPSPPPQQQQQQQQALPPAPQRRRPPEQFAPTPRADRLAQTLRSNRGFVNLTGVRLRSVAQRQQRLNPPALEQPPPAPPAQQQEGVHFAEYQRSTPTVTRMRHRESGDIMTSTRTVMTRRIPSEGEAERGHDDYMQSLLNGAH